jgi:hypothetical protein
MFMQPVPADRSGFHHEGAMGRGDKEKNAASDSSARRIL